MRVSLLLTGTGVVAGMSASSLLASVSPRGAAPAYPPAPALPTTFSSSITQTIDTAEYNLTAVGRIYSSPAGMSLQWTVGATTPDGGGGGAPSPQVQLTNRALARTYHLEQHTDAVTGKTSVACTYQPAKPAAAAMAAPSGGANDTSAAPTFGGDTWVGAHLVDVFVMAADVGQTSLMATSAFTGRLVALVTGSEDGANNSFAQFGDDFSTAAPDDSMFEVPAYILATCTPAALPALGLVSLPW